MDYNDDLTELFLEGHNRKYQKGQILLYQGERTDDVFYIKSGHIKVYDVTSQGNEKLIMIIGPKDIFPLVWTFKHSEPLHYFYESFDDIEISVIPRTKLTNEIKTNHPLTLTLLKYFVDRSSELMARINCIEATSAKHKVAQVLLYLATAHGDLDKNNIALVNIPITHQSIANLAGLTRATTSLQMKSLEKRKLFKNKGNQLVINIDKINNFIENEE